MDMLEKTLRWMLELLKNKMHNRFYGTITLKFESGKLVQVKSEESIKPPDLG